MLVYNTLTNVTNVIALVYVEINVFQSCKKLAFFHAMQTIMQ